MQGAEIVDQGALFAQVIDRCRVEQVVQLVEAVEQLRVAAEDGGEGLQLRVVAEAQLVLQVAQPGAVDLKHPIRPGLAVYRVAAMHVAGVHQHQGACANLFARLFIEVGAATPGDGAD